MIKTTVYEMFMQGGYETIVEMSMYSCGCDNIRLPLDNYYESIDGTVEKFLEDYLVYKYVEEYDIVETTEKSLILVIKLENKCTDCKYGKTYMKNMPRPVGFEDVMLFHGILAYQRESDDFEGARRHLEKVLTIPTYETCCSTEPIGNVGAVLEGTVILASNCDLGSKTDEKGRYFMKQYEEANYIIYDADYLTFGTDGMNDEIVTIENKIKAIWVKDNANNTEKAYAEELAAYYNVELIVEQPTESDIQDMYCKMYGLM